MTSREEVIAEELEALESIYIDELEKLSDDEVRIRIDPDEDAPLPGAGLPSIGKDQEEEEDEQEQISLFLTVKFTESYPDQAPEMTLSGGEEDISEKDRIDMLVELQTVAEESLGMAMVFTLASHMKETISNYLRREQETKQKEEAARKEAEFQAEQEKFRGTAVTKERFLEWRAKFDAEREAAALKGEEEKLKGMTAKEREEYKRFRTKPSGRQLFEKGPLQEDTSKVKDEEDAQEIDWDLYSREERERERLLAEEEERNRENMERLQFEEEDDD